MRCGRIAELSCAFAMVWQLWRCVLARGGTSSWGSISGSVVVHIVFCVYFCGFMRVWFAVMFLSPRAVVYNYSLCLCYFICVCDH